jgi:hypothetical protein
MIYYWAIFILLGLLTVLNARSAVALYWRNKLVFFFICHIFFSAILVVILMHSTVRIMDILEIRFQGLTGLTSDLP